MTKSIARPRPAKSPESDLERLTRLGYMAAWVYLSFSFFLRWIAADKPDTRAERLWRANLPDLNELGDLLYEIDDLVASIDGKAVSIGGLGPIHAPSYAQAAHDFLFDWQAVMDSIAKSTPPKKLRLETREIFALLANEAGSAAFSYLSDQVLAEIRLAKQRVRVKDFPRLAVRSPKRSGPKVGKNDGRDEFAWHQFQKTDLSQSAIVEIIYNAVSATGIAPGTQKP